ncbi:MAG: hypothetical protein GWO20_06485 [Candidatus Korarchaeota archaeon]|nr:hypothetical protein [Candidatus Korarchaeota archaeon]NIU83092.1 hypothetical protein [Candidatus Thorarchaeota archaeon]NIW13470.1 hypothetical protein [Candidatus Thorarchaeota archaeon]
MKKIQGTLIACLLTIAILTSMPLAPARGIQSQDQKYIKAIDGKLLEQPITVEAFVKQLSKANKKPTRENDKRLIVASPNEREANQEASTLSIVSSPDRDPWVNITKPQNGTDFPYNNQTGCTVTIEWNTSASAGIERFTIDWTVGEERNEIQVIENGSVRMATHTYTYHRANHTIRLTVVDGHGETDSDTVFIRDSSFTTIVVIRSPSDGATLSGSNTIKVYASVCEYEEVDGFNEIIGYHAVDDLYLYVDGGQVKHWTNVNGERSYDWDTTTYSDGEHTIAAKAESSTGGTDTDSITVTVDNTAPQVSQFDYQKFVQTHVDVAVDAYDGGSYVENVTVYIAEDKSLKNGTSPNSKGYEGTLSLDNLDSKLGEGIWTLALYVEDGLGNSDTEYTDLVVDVSPPEVRQF